MCEIKNIEFLSDGNRLVGTVYKTTKQKVSPGILFLHGAGSSSSARYELWQKYLCERGYTSFIFDCRGVGKSEGEFPDGGLNNRLKDAENALQAFLSLGIVDENNICIIGSSMSGHTAIRLTEKFKNITAVILAYAAAYSEEAEDKKLDDSFTQAIRKENSWVNSPAFSILEKFSGRVLVIYGENEEIIPKGVQERFIALVKDRGESYLIENIGHKMLQPSNEEEKEAMQKMFKISADFLDKTFAKTA